MIKQHSIKVRFVLIAGIFLALALIGSSFAWPLMQVQAGPTLPPRPAPGNGGDSKDKKDDGGPLLAHIELQVQQAPANVWSIVQWQDSDGNWHDVEGWRGVLHNGYQRWAVEAKDFNTRPFRWQVRRGREGVVLGTSDLFDLPAGANQVVRVQVLLDKN